MKLPRPLLGPVHSDRMSRMIYRKYCDVCDEITNAIMIVAEDPEVKTQTLSISCHGSTETAVFNELDILINDYDDLYGSVYRWMMDAFKTEMGPDVRLALAYSQGRTMKEPK